MSLALLVVAIAVLAASPALAAGRHRDSSRRNCSQLTAQDFDRVGEHVMERMLGSTQAHESMDRLMAQMMGPANERRMHVVMGERFTGCGNSPLPGGYAGMMGAMGMMGGFGPNGQGGAGAGGAYGPGMMGGFGSAPGNRAAPGGDGAYGLGSMMGVDRGRGDDGNGNMPVGWMIAMILVLVLGGAAAVYFIARGSTRRSDPRQLLAHRFARGEIDAEEYRRRSELLGGAK